VFGESPAIAGNRQKIESVSWANVPVLIQGESGLERDHREDGSPALGARPGKPFVKVNCALFRTTSGIELLGTKRDIHRRDMYPSRPCGACERWHVVLDEIAEMDLGLQAKLLQLLQDNQLLAYRRRDHISVDVENVCAKIRKSRF